jgi:hypothetical protein
MMDDETRVESGTGRTSLVSRGCGLIGCVLLIVLVVGVVAGAYFAGNALEPLADRFLWTPADLVRVYLAAYEEGNKERARSFLCDDVRGGGGQTPPAPVPTPTLTSGADHQ